ncbi:MAG: hypothetical protein ACYCT7_11030 [bacterium]
MKQPKIYYKIYKSYNREKTSFHGVGSVRRISSATAADTKIPVFRHWEVCQ